MWEIKKVFLELNFQKLKQIKQKIKIKQFKNNTN